MSFLPHWASKVWHENTYSEQYLKNHSHSKRLNQVENLTPGQLIGQRCVELELM